MPYDKDPDHPECPSDKPIGVIKTTDGELMGCHATEESADDQIAALYAAEEERMAQKQNANIVVSIQDGLIEAFSALHDGIQRFLETIKPRAWDGSASNYESTEQYCSACLIDVNQGDTKTQDHCMLPVKAAGSDSYDFEGIQAAAGGHGVSQVEKPDDVPEDEWNAAVKKAANTIISQYEANDETAPDSVYKAADKESPSKEDTARAVGLGQIFSQVDQALYTLDNWPWLLDLYLDDGAIFAIATAGGKLYKFPVNVEGAAATIGEGVEVEPMFEPVSGGEEARSRTMVWRTAEGKWRWLSISCTAILNRVGEIDTRALFDSMIAHAEETGEYPYRTFYHCGEALKYGQADYLAREGYVFISSGIFDTEGENGDLALAEIEARQKAPGIWGESIGYKPTEAPILVPVADGIEVLAFNAGQCREISNCLEIDACALFTQSETQEVSRMREKIKDALAKLGIGQERIDEFEEKVDGTNRTVADQGLIAREAGTEDSPPEEPEAPAAPAAPDTPGEGGEGDEEEEPVELEIGDDVIENVASVATERLLDPEGPLMHALADITGAVESLRESAEAASGLLDQRIAALEATDDEKRERWLEDLPRRPAVRLTYRPREAHAQDQPEEAQPTGEPEDYAAQAAATVSNISAAY